MFPLRITTTTVARHRMNLLYIITGRKSRYILVKDLSRLVLSQYNNHNSKQYFCQYCFHGCTGEEVLKNHLERCKLHGALRIIVPGADNKSGCEKFKFRKTEYQLYLLFVIYSDFESVLYIQDSCEPSSSKSFTTQYQKHVPCESCIYVKCRCCSDGQYFEPPQVTMGMTPLKDFSSRS